MKTPSCISVFVSENEKYLVFLEVRIHRYLLILRAEGVTAAAQKSLHRQYNTDFSTSEYFLGKFPRGQFPRTFREV